MDREFKTVDVADETLVEKLEEDLDQATQKLNELDKQNAKLQSNRSQLRAIICYIQSLLKDNNHENNGQVPQGAD